MCNIVYKMKIGIIGNGFVGRATQIFAKNYNALDEFTPITVYIYDIRPEACDPPGITLEELDRECDLLFFCLPTPLHHDGSCYTRILEETIAKCPTNPYKVIRSTVPVGFAAKHGCYFIPEFLTEANWEDDFRRTKEWVVGIPAVATATTALTDEFKKRIQTLITTSHDNRAIDSDQVTFTTTNEAEMLKLMKNCFLSAKVSLMNEFYDFCAATGTDYNRVTTLAKRDARMGVSHFQVPGADGRRGFGGTCFPKDTHSLYCQMNAHGMTPQIYPAILARNDTVDRPEREWSRDVWRTTIPLPTPASKVVVVFSDESSLYLVDIIRDNLAKNNVVIQIVRAAGSGNGCGASQPIHKNHLVKHRANPNAPLFFPRVDECYYTQRTGDTLYDIMREVSCVIDLWDSHEEMKLYVVKQSRYGEHESEHESGTEGFDSDDDADRDDDADAYTKSRLYDDYATTIIEEYFTKVVSVIPKNKRGLIVLF
jgi:UDPglucose 6-dehydrogenase